MLTKRQKSFRRHGFVPEILFSQVNRLATSFQGALPFNHGADCTKCWNGKLSHVHIFFQCKDPDAVRLRTEADTIIDHQNLIPRPRRPQQRRDKYSLERTTVLEGMVPMRTGMPSNQRSDGYHFLGNLETKQRVVYCVPTLSIWYRLTADWAMKRNLMMSHLILWRA